MTFRTLINRSLRHHWRAHLGVVLGAAVGSAALIGALVVGDSVKESLRERALARLYHVYAAMNTGDRFFTRNLFDRMEKVNADRVQSSNSPVFGWRRSKNVPQSGYDLIHLPASISLVDGTSRLNQISVFGTGGEFFTISLPGIARRATVMLDHLPALERGETWVNSALAHQLNVHPGDMVVLRIPKRNSFGGENPLAPRNDQPIALRLKVGGVLPASIGDLSLRGSGAPALNVFVNQSQLEEAAGIGKRANLLLARAAVRWRPLTKMEAFEEDYMIWRSGHGKNPFLNLHWLRNAGNVKQHAIGVPVSGDEAAAEASAMLAQAWTLADAECKLAPTSSPGGELELRTSRIFLDPPLARVARVVNTNAQPILTYLVNLLRAGTNTTPYSMVTAAGAPWTSADMRDDEIIVSQWLADDLQVKPGDSIDVSYFLPESGARLAEATNRFRVHSIVPMTMPWADRTLMPEFPGIEKAERTQDWDAGFPLTLKIRDQDEAYWKQWRGTPKAFVTLAAGQKMWGNRFGNLTAIRWPVPTNAVGRAVLSAPPGEGTTNGALGQTRPTNAVEEFRRAIEANLLANLNPADFGLRFEPVREQALKAAEQSQDFGGLFIGFSFFLIAAALILMALLFRFGLEQRVTEVGTLLALGFTPKQVRRLFLSEGAALAALGTALGLAGGVGYAWLMIRGLTTIWRDAIASSALGFHVTPGTLVMGAVAAVLVCAGTLWLTLRKLGRQPTRELLAGEVSAGRDGFHSVPVAARLRDAVERVPTTLWKNLRRVLASAAAVAWGALAAAVAILGWAVAKGETSNAEVFFSAGSLLLIAGIAFAALLFRRLESRPGRFTLPSLGLRGCTRRRNRSLAVVGLLACGSFLIAAIGSFKLDANTDAWKRASGTGGFALLGESTMPVVKDLNTRDGLDFFSLDAATLTNVSFVPLRVRDGDDASCLNLNRAQKPRLLGVKPEMLAERGAFTFAKVAKGFEAKDGWRLLVNAERGMRNAESPSPTDAAASIRNPQSAIRIPEVPEVPAIGDLNSILWAMGKKVGDTLDYVDERGQPFKVRLVGAVANSVLQGSLLIDEAEFAKRFPGEAGYRMFLIDTPSNRVSAVSAELSRGLQNLGLEVTAAARRLAQFNAVQNTYLNTFQVLGGLGLLLGSAGLGVVVLRNVLERRNEFAVLQAVGFRQRQLQRLVLGEHGALLLLGLVVGIVSAMVAVLPSVLSPAAELPWRSLAVTLGGVLAVGLLATWLATRWALRGTLTDALRSE